MMRSRWTDGGQFRHGYPSRSARRKVAMRAGIDAGIKVPILVGQIWGWMLEQLPGNRCMVLAPFEDCRAEVHTLESTIDGAGRGSRAGGLVASTRRIGSQGGPERRAALRVANSHLLCHCP